MAALYLEDSYLQEFDATVVSVKDGKYVVLDQTAFYPQGGGQPCDYGELVKDGTRFKMLSVGKFEGSISHEVDAVGLHPGDKVHGVVDWQRRHKLMRMHTAAHLLSAVFHKEAGALITGNQLDVEQSRIDFSLDAFDKDKINEYAAKANGYVKQALPVTVKFMPRVEAMKIPDVVKLANALPPDVHTLRIVEIQGVDVQADGGTHVRNTAEVGTITVVKTENKGKNNRRVYFSVA
ncbi:alanyl-tRNA editing protein [Candidatus Woesearchaeota archaeon]|nr:alanyl-tRNA editing protein [Candidatus Woesearchaeota archaeon]